MLNESLCDCAVNDLQRFVAPDCYLDTPEAYLTFARNILATAQSLTPRMTMREREAAQALNDMALYEIRNRSIYEESPQSLTADQERELWGRLEVFRRSALVYARTINDAQLIEDFEQPLEPPKNGLHGSRATRKPNDAVAPRQPHNPHTKWTESELRGLLEDTKLGQTHNELAIFHGVTRQLIGTLVKKAQDKFEPKKAIDLSMAGQARTVTFSKKK